MDQTVHIFINEEMAEIAKAISSYISVSGCADVLSNTYFITINKTDKDFFRANLYGNGKLLDSIDMDYGNASAHFANLYNRIKVVGNPNPILYAYVYTQLYKEEQYDILRFIVENISASNKSYETNVYALASDMVCAFESKNYVCPDIKKLQSVSLEALQQISELKKSYFLKRILLLQNSNVQGLGINFNKIKLVRFFGEFVTLTTEQNSGIFPPSYISNKDYSSLGLSSLWFDLGIFVDYTSAYIVYKILKKEGLTSKDFDMVCEKQLLESNKKLIGDIKAVFPHCINYVDIHRSEPNVNEKTAEDCDEQFAKIDEFIRNINKRTDLNIYEKICLLALLKGKKYRLSNGNIISDDNNSIKLVYEDIFQWYIDRNNIIIKEGGKSVLTSPINSDGLVYQPVEKLTDLHRSIERLEKGIHEKQQRLDELQETIEEYKRVNPGEYQPPCKLLHDIKEEPLKDTYQPDTSRTPARSVDLRSLFSPIRNQGQVGACSTFTMSSIFEFIINCYEQQTGASLSPRFVYYHAAERTSDGRILDTGSNFFTVVRVLGDYGVCKENLCPFSQPFDQEPSNEASEEAKKRLVTKAENVNLDHMSLTSALSEGYPIAISLNLYKSFYSPINGFIFHPSDEEIASGVDSHHAMVICGYSEKDKVYIVRNSWGEDFGDKGYCYIPFSYIEDPNLCNMACIITGVSCNEVRSFNAKGDVVFNLADKSIEYAVTKIMMDEEVLFLKKLGAEYFRLLREYHVLQLELQDPEVRDKIKTEYRNVKRGEENPIVETPGDVDGKSGNLKIGLLSMAAFVIAALFLFIFPDAIKYSGLLGSISIVCAVISGIYAFPKNQVRKPQHNEICTPKPDVDEMYFTIAERTLNRVMKIENEADNAYRDIRLYIYQLGELFLENNRNLENAEALLNSISVPFTFVYSKEEMQSVDVDFEALNTRIETLRESKTNFKKDFMESIRRQLSDRYSEFSMRDYLISLYKQGKALQFVTNLKFQSLPFVNVFVYSKEIQCSVFIENGDDKQNAQFEKFCNNTFGVVPNLCFGCSPYKFVCVNLDDFDRNELQMFENKDEEQEPVPEKFNNKLKSKDDA